ncbi:MAG: CHASE2 domain-containing protein [Thainema sp.]
MALQSASQLVRSAWSKLKQTVFPRNALGIQGVLVAAILITGGTWAVRYWDGLQALELKVYDRFMRVRSQLEPDHRILIVGITEVDLRRFQRSTLSDKDLAQVLQLIQRQQPAVIGLDLYRDVPQHVGLSELRPQLQAENLIAITLIGDDENTSVPPPPNVPEERVGFNDLINDSDGVVRRNLLFGATPDGTVYYSFSLRVAIAYLAQQNILPKPSDQNPEYLQLGAATFEPLKQNSGAYKTVDDAGYQILLNYRADTAPARIVSVSDILTRKVPPEWIEDQIVLIGTVAPSSKDLFFTPYSAGNSVESKMAGINVHAQMVSQFLDAATGERDLFTYWPEWAEFGWMLAWALLGGTVAWQIRHTLVLIGVAAVTAGGLVLVSYGIFQQGVWIPVVAPLIAMGATEAAMVTYRAQQAQRQQQMVMTLLGQNTSPEIARALWENRENLVSAGKLPGQKLTATLLFSDLKNFSTMAEQMPPEQLLLILNQYLGEMTEVVQSNNGIINKFTGDGLLAVFGVPIERMQKEEVATDAHNAVVSALKMGERLQTLNQIWRSQNLPELQMRVGIFTGPIVAGSLGGKDRMEYGVIGDSVNVASRLESCEKHRHKGVCRILITNHTLDLLNAAQFVVEAWGLIELKGRQQPVQVYQVLDYAPYPHCPLEETADQSLPAQDLTETPSAAESALSTYDARDPEVM